ncbi:MAG TPA: hypothetical protein VFI38_17915 [Candidatus Acidoferrum sp.]|nr:hypothetical protein [Candidatus Acidoferrum sp.]
MALNKNQAALGRLREFFLAEVQSEVDSGFKRLTRIPDSHVTDKIRYFESLALDDKHAFLHCCAYWASAYYGFVVGMDGLSLADHPFFPKWSQGPRWGGDFDSPKSVPLLRALVQQYKIDRHNGIRSHITKQQFEEAAAVRSVKAAELRKRARMVLKSFGHFETDTLNQYWCKLGKRKFMVHLDFGGRTAQLRYSVARLEFKGVHPLSQFRLERAMGFGLGNWDYIVEESVDDVFALFAEVVQYSFELPDRIRAAVRS